MEELKGYIQNILKQIYFDYRDDLGLENELRLFSYVNEGGISFTESASENVLCIPVPEENNSLWREKDLIPFLFKQFLPTDRVKKDDFFNLEFANFLKNGIASIYTKEFCTRHNYTYVPQEQYQANAEYAKEVLNHLSTTLSTHKVVFLYSYQEIMEYVQISTRNERNPNGINYYTIYMETYLKENDWPYIEDFVVRNITNSLEEAKMILETYKKIQKKIIITNDLKEKIQEKYQNNPEILQARLEELNDLFKTGLSGSGRDKSDTTRVLKSDGYLKGSIILVLTVAFGILIALLLLINQ